MKTSEHSPTSCRLGDDGKITVTLSPEALDALKDALYDYGEALSKLIENETANPTCFSEGSIDANDLDLAARDTRRIAGRLRRRPPGGIKAAQAALAEASHVKAWYAHLAQTARKEARS